MEHFQPPAFYINIERMREALEHIDSRLDAMNELLMGMIEAQNRLVDVFSALVSPELLDTSRFARQDESLRERGEMHTVTNTSPPA